MTAFESTLCSHLCERARARVCCPRRCVNCEGMLMNIGMWPSDKTNCSWILHGSAKVHQIDSDTSRRAAPLLASRKEANIRTLINHVWCVWSIHSGWLKVEGRRLFEELLRCASCRTNLEGRGVIIITVSMERRNVFFTFSCASRIPGNSWGGFAQNLLQGSRRFRPLSGHSLKSYSEVLRGCRMSFYLLQVPSGIMSPAKPPKN